MEETEVIQTKNQSAITVNVQSWATPIVGVVMLIIGLLGGYYGRPLVGSDDELVAVPQAVQPSQPQGSGVSNEELMDYLNSQVRHVVGDSEAPVTIVEFGDFQ